MNSTLAIKPTSGGTLRQRLREETDAIHQSLHKNPGLSKLADGHASMQDYVSVLNTFFHFYREVDDFFDFISQSQRFNHEATPLVWLAQDFSVLNQPVPARSPSFQVRPIGELLPKRFETYIGFLYVKQGSTLGGQTISKQLKKTLMLEPGESQFFFEGFGEQTGSYWKEFLNYLSLHEPALDTELVIKGAHTFFHLLDVAFKQHFPLEA